MLVLRGLKKFETQLCMLTKYVISLGKRLETPRSFQGSSFRVGRHFFMKSDRLSPSPVLAAPLWLSSACRPALRFFARFLLLALAVGGCLFTASGLDDTTATGNDFFLDIGAGGGS